MKTSSRPPFTHLVVRGSWLVVKSTLNSLVATLVLALALFASFVH
jgi:hypothetical protein